MTALITDPNLPSPDDFYEILLAAHDGLSDDASEEFNARLILILPIISVTRRSSNKP